MIWWLVLVFLVVGGCFFESLVVAGGGFDGYFLNGRW